MSTYRVSIEDCEDDDVRFPCPQQPLNGALLEEIDYVDEDSAYINSFVAPTPQTSHLPELPHSSTVPQNTGHSDPLSPSGE